jgi:hypothetical protein
MRYATLSNDMCMSLKKTASRSSSILLFLVLIRSSRTKPKWSTKLVQKKGQKLLFEFMMDETVPMEDNPNMPLDDIYLLHLEVGMYDLKQLKGRLDRLRARAKELDTRADKDLAAFRTYKKNHNPSLFWIHSMARVDSSGASLG